MSSRPDDTSIFDRARDLAAALREPGCDEEVGRPGNLLGRLHALRQARSDGPAVLDACARELRTSGHFDLLGACFQESLCADPFHQVDDVENPGAGIRTLTTVRMEGYDPEEVHAAVVHMPWDVWWRHGRVAGWRRRAGGDVSFVLWPLWPKAPIRVRITIEPAVEVEERVDGLARTKKVMTARFAGFFEGPARFEVVRLPDGCVLRAAWDGIRPRGWTRVLSSRRIAQNHLAAEKGVMPGAAGGGYLGLRSFLKP
ncbi:MAG: hypothetical protein AAFY88_28260, partial [Acidobacteriota bacterium]